METRLVLSNNQWKQDWFYQIIINEIINESQRIVVPAGYSSVGNYEYLKILFLSIWHFCTLMGL